MNIRQIHHRYDQIAAQATQAARNCEKIITDYGLETAVNYCSSLKIKPPTLSLVTEKVKAQGLHDEAVRKLTNEVWWNQQLKARAERDVEVNRKLQA